MNIKKFLSISMWVLLLTFLVSGQIVSAQVTEHMTGKIGGNIQGNGGGKMRMMTPGVFGTVTSVNGTSIMVSGKVEGPMMFASTTLDTTFTIDATNAKVRKNNATSTVSEILVGDKISVQGTITGSNVVATSIIDGMVPRGMEGRKNDQRDQKGGMMNSQMQERVHTDVRANASTTKVKTGFFGGIGRFFSHLFNF